MSRHLSTLLSTLPFVAIAALGIWIFHLNQAPEPETVAVVERPADTPAATIVEESTAPPAMSPLEMEQRRLADLRQRLDESRPHPETPAPPASIDIHIEVSERQLGEVQKKLEQTKDETPGDRAALETQLQRLETEILETQDEAKLATLKAERESVDAQLRAAGPRTLTERDDLQRQLGDLRADIEYWQGIKSGAGPGVQTARVQQLEEEIKAQEARVRALEDLNPKTEVQ